MDCLDFMVHYTEESMSKYKIARYNSERRKVQSALNLTNSDLLFMPVVEGNHWYLAGFSYSLKFWFVFDSLGQTGMSKIHKLHNTTFGHLSRTIKFLCNSRDSFHFLANTQAVQSNSIDCGIWILIVAELLAFGCCNGFTDIA